MRDDRTPAPDADPRHGTHQAPRWRRGVFGTNPTPLQAGGPRRDRHWTSRLLHDLGAATAHSGAGAVAALALAAWFVVGLSAGFPDWWELVLYSATAAVTLLMVFVIQHTQARQTAAIQRKLDELLRASLDADATYIAAEEAPDRDLETLAELSEVDRVRAQEDRLDQSAAGRHRPT